MDGYNESDGGVNCFSLEGKGLAIANGTTVRLTVTDEEGSASVEAPWLDIG